MSPGSQEAESEECCRSSLLFLFVIQFTVRSFAPKNSGSSPLISSVWLFPLGMIRGVSPVGSQTVLTTTHTMELVTWDLQEQEESLVR